MGFVRSIRCYIFPSLIVGDEGSFSGMQINCSFVVMTPCTTRMYVLDCGQRCSDFGVYMIRGGWEVNVYKSDTSSLF